MTLGTCDIRYLICLVTLIAQALGVIPHPIPEVNILMVEIPTPKPYIFMIRVIRIYMA
jgi:hypothetical protein